MPRSCLATLVPWVLSLALAGCGSEPEPAPAEEAAPAPDEPPDEPPVETPPEVYPDPPPPVDLLHAVETTVTVSSAFGGDAGRVAMLWDEDLTSTWCADAGQAAGAWIEVRVPSDAFVEHLRMTNGDTATRGGRDLYRAQHRIRRVRVSRNGTEIGTFPLDPDDQTLQHVPARGEGGTWRIEVVDVVPGTAETMREACVSGLQVMGSGPGLEPGAHTPTGQVSAAAAGEAFGDAEELVDLLHAVATTVRVSSAEDDDPANVEAIADGDAATVFRTRDGDRAGAFVEVELPADATIARIEVAPEAGQRLPIRRVRLVHDGIPFGERELSATPPAVPTIEVIGSGGIWRLEVVEATGPIAIGELRVFGRHATATEGEHDPSFELAPTTEEGEAAPALALATDPAAGALFGEAEGLRVTELSLGSGVEDRQIVDARATYSRASDERIYCLVRLENPSREASGILMGWERIDRPTEDAGRLMNVPAQPRYVTFGMTGTRRPAGRYRCVVRTPGGALLGSVAFDLAE